MILTDGVMTLPDYHSFSQAIMSLNLSVSGAEFHGVLCGYLTSGGNQGGESYIRSILAKKHNDATRIAASALFDLLAISQHQLLQVGFEFQLLLPEDDQSLLVRAQAFSEWCEGFILGLTVNGLNLESLHNDDAQDALQHLIEFAKLDYEALQVSEDDERALMEVVEYTRMAVLTIHMEAQADQKGGIRVH